MRTAIGGHLTDLAKRILVAVPAAILLIYVTWLGGAGFYVLLGIISLLALVEMSRMFARMSSGVWPAVAVMIGVAIWSQELLSAWQGGWMLLAIAAGLTWGLWVSGSERRERLLATLFCGIYAPVGFLFLWKIRLLEGQEMGFWLVLTLLLMIWANDISAYFGGRRFGRRPLAPSVSPKKTWEGFWFGLAGSAAVLLLILWMVEPLTLVPLSAFPLIVIVGVFGPAGDLLVSRLKRLSDLKDSSSILPGHGGMMDRFDSLILTAPIFYFYLIQIL